MLSAAQKKQFEDEGYLVLEGVLNQGSVLDPVRREYAALIDDLYVQ